MTSKTYGVIGSFLGGVLTAVGLYLALQEREVYVVLTLLGPAFLVTGLAYLLFPIEKLLRPKEVEGKLVYSLGYDKYTALGWLVNLLGPTSGGLVTAACFSWR